MAITPNGKYLYAALEGATVADTNPSRRNVLEFSVADGAFTGRTWWYHTDQPGYFVADMWALDQHRIAVIERDGGSGLNALFRNVYVVDLRDVDASGFLVKNVAVNFGGNPRSRRRLPAADP